MSKISVIIPAYNCECYIERCLQSVLKQTWLDVELIVIDDGSESVWIPVDLNAYELIVCTLFNDNETSFPQFLSTVLWKIGQFCG